MAGSRVRGPSESWVWGIINPVVMIGAIVGGGIAGWSGADWFLERHPGIPTDTILDEVFINAPASVFGAYLAAMFAVTLLDRRG